MDNLYTRARELASVSACEPATTTLASACERLRAPPASTDEHSLPTCEPSSKPVRESCVVGFNLAALGIDLHALGCASRRVGGRRTHPSVAPVRSQMVSATPNRLVRAAPPARAIVRCLYPLPVPVAEKKQTLRDRKR
jgi:hypothetical protein